MAIISEFYKERADGVRLVRTHSDEGVFIQKEGTDEVYASAVDMEGHSFVYRETEIPLDGEVEEI